VTVRGTTVAGLNLYAPTVRAFGPEKRAAAAAFAEAAGTAVGLALRLAEQEQLTEQVQQALVSRSGVQPRRAVRQRAAPARRGSSHRASRSLPAGVRCRPSLRTTTPFTVGVYPPPGSRTAPVSATWATPG
jgi:hypothetical protein